MLQATVKGINDAFLVSTLMIGVALILALFIKRGHPGDEEAYLKK